MSKIYKCAKNCGNIEEVKVNDGHIPVCCGVEMIEDNKSNGSESLGCFGCMGCYGGSEKKEENL